MQAEDGSGTHTTVIEDNWLCGEQALRVPEGSTLTLDPSNEVCAG